MSVSENIEVIKDVIVNHIGTAGAVIITTVLSAFVKKVIDASISYLADKSSHETI